MSKLTLFRTDSAPLLERDKEAVKAFLFGAIDGCNEEHRTGWRRIWNRIMRMEAGEAFNVEMAFPRSGPYHRRHLKIESAVFDAQDRFTNFEMFRDWLKIGAAWVVWVPGPKGGIVPLPKSVSYAAADQDEFAQYHKQIIEFLRGEHAAPYLWRHLKDGRAHDMMDSILGGFGE